MRKSIIIVLSLFYFSSIFLFGQNNKVDRYVFSSYSIERGLSQNSVISALQDVQGYMWFGTWDGLNRFDGYSFKVYRNNPTDSNSISNNSVVALFQDSYGDMWMATDGGLNRFDRKKEVFIHYTHDEMDSTSISSDNVRSITEDKKGNLWIGTRGGGLCMMDRYSGKFKRIGKNEVSADIWTVYIDRSNTLWIGSFTQGLYRYDFYTKKFSRFVNNPQRPDLIHDSVERGTVSDNVIRSILEDQQGNLWIGTFHRGLNNFDRSRNVFVHYMNNPNDPKSLSNNRVESVLEDKKGNIWVATFGGGLNLMNKETETFSAFKHDNADQTSIGSDKIWGLCQDRSGVIWTGSSGKGVSKFNPYKKQFDNYLPSSDDLFYLKSVSFVYANDFNNIWLGTLGGLAKFNIETGKISRVRADIDKLGYLSSARINTISSGLSGKLWLGYEGFGVASVDLQTLYNIETPGYKASAEAVKTYTIGDSYIKTISEDSAGFLLVGSNDGGLAMCDISSIEDGGYQNFKNIVGDASTISDNAVFSIFKDKAKIYWIGTRNGGLCRFDPKSGRFTSYKHNPNDSLSISNNTVNVMYQSNDATLWIGTTGGLNKMIKKTGKFIHYTIEEGLPSNIILSIQEDNYGNLWLGTDYGLAKFDIKTGKVKKYSSEDGLMGNGFSGDASLKLPDGRLVYSCGQGLVIFNPDSIKDNNHIPEVVLTKMQLFNKEVQIGEWKGHNILKASLSQTDHIELKYHENVLSFEFSALDYVLPERNKYAYKLEGFEDDWNYTTSDRRYATYTNLNPGEYILYVKASNNDGVWNNKGVKLIIVIRPPFWKTWWFIILSTFVLAWLIYAYIQYRNKIVKLEKERLNNKIKEAIHEVETQKAALMLKNQEMLQQQENEKLQNWFNEGLSIMNDASLKNKENLQLLLNAMLKNLIQYLNVSQGCVMLHKRNNDTQEEYFEIDSWFAYDRERLMKKTFTLTEGLVGACYLERQYIYITEIPDGYLRLSSGMGEDKPKALLLVPIMMDTDVLGIIEIGSFQLIEQYKIDFVRRVSENLASSIYVLQTTNRISEMYQRSQEQSARLVSQEEELRQNLEEMHATHEEMQRKESDMLTDILQLREKIVLVEKDNVNLRRRLNLSQFSFSKNEEEIDDAE